MVRETGPPPEQGLGLASNVVGSAQVDLGASMPRARTGPILVLAGGVLSAVGMIVGWSKITMSYGGNYAETVTNTTPMAVFGVGLLLIGGYFLFQRVTARRRFSEAIAAIGGILILTSVAVEF